ncbi:hypothetical protein GUITHDRAFT_143674 [Guillardia theta CCMP2712]|uniref:Uncharacterized protein n=1 Tax=Guillardia theta (strain CCMP2712) TaxID=905079 RepID=L1IT72_GUITC|nr:hypothetical protein GUITHDRAFT_143674 [Guillardia theta CCMP2712]EKX39272.1 hypothetical protein GUITHDRAFT_143674 [Guillardia theta CCMP2712]|eukprot:XP_005826252.1 hypothetical protein GUITHDRAFT_143674 [Guillardia theta CCMP2712]
MRRRQGATVHLLLVLVLVVGLLKDLAPCSAAAQEEGRATKYIWLMQGKEEMSLDFLRSDHSDAIQVVWGKGPKNHSKDAYYLPDSTCTEGRNFLLQMALLREEEEGIRYDYFIYTEDDAELEEILDFGHNVGDPYRTFERYLHMWEPAVAFPFNGYGMPDPPEEVVAACWWDHLMVAFHRDALPALLPYWTGFDKESWWFPQRIVTVLSAAFFHENRIQGKRQAPPLLFC